MLVLEKITLQTNRRSFMNSSQKYLRISFNKEVFITNQPAKVMSPTQIQWNQIAKLPLLFDTQYTFEIYDQHHFGYNPQELTKVLSGKIVIDVNDNFCSWNVLNEKKQKAGFLSASIIKKKSYDPNQRVENSEKQVCTISSIAAHLSNLKSKRGYAIIKIGFIQHRTELCKSKKGELLFVDPLIFEKNSDQSDAIIEIFSYDARDDSSQEIATGKFIIDDIKGDRSVTLRDKEGKTVGEAFIDYKTMEQNYYNSSKILNKIVQSSIAQSADLNKNQNNPLELWMIVIGNVTEFSRFKKLPSHKKKSVLNENGGIFMPKQGRFRQYKDQSSQQISYLSEKQREMGFKSGYTQAYVRGASIGKGTRADFSTGIKENPGVGVYNLPSIWDRY